MDTKWNNLNFFKVQRHFGNNQIHKLGLAKEQLYAEELFMKAKEVANSLQMGNTQFSDEFYQELKMVISFFGSPQLHSDYFRHRAELFRMRAIIHFQKQRYSDAITDLSDSVKMCEVHFKTWYTWLNIGFSQFMNYSKEGTIHWISQPICCATLALRYKPYKTRLYISRILYIILSVQQQAPDIKVALDEFIRDVPLWTILTWTPQFLQNVLDDHYKESFSQLLKKICDQFPQYMFYILKGFIK